MRHYDFIYQWACELLDNPHPGRDYALTELARCGTHSVAELGQAAVDRCSDLYLDDVLDLAAAKVVIVLGALASSTMRSRYALPLTVVAGPLPLPRRVRMVAFLRHPGYFRYHRASRSLGEQLGSAELGRLREFARA